MNYPLVVFGLSVLMLWSAARFGVRLQRRRAPMDEDERDDFKLILGATLTLLGLILGFSFSMATTRYDTRKTLEEAEANAIGTEWVRVDLLPTENGIHIRDLLRSYLAKRIDYYRERSESLRAGITNDTNRLQGELWQAVAGPGVASQTPITALAVSGMNDVLNAQGYMQAAWWNRIPTEAWGLLVLIAICANFLFGFGGRRLGLHWTLQLIVPVVLSIAFFLVADIDSPRGGLVRIQPRNMLALQQSLP